MVPIFRNLVSVRSHRVSKMLRKLVILLRNQRMQRGGDLEIIPYTQCPKFIPDISQITSKQPTFPCSPDENEKCKKGLGRDSLHQWRQQQHFTHDNTMGMLSSPDVLGMRTTTARLFYTRRERCLWYLMSVSHTLNPFPLFLVISLFIVNLTSSYIN